MKTKKKKLLITSVLLSIAIIFSAVQYIRYYKIPDKRPVDMKFEEVEGIIPLDYNTKQIYVIQDADRGNIIVGADGKHYNRKSTEEYERVRITGDIPETFDKSLSGNMFILNGEYIGIKKLNNQDYNYGTKTFKVESWDINNVHRNGNENNKSTEYLTKSDYDGTFTISIPEKDLYDVD